MKHRHHAVLKAVVAMAISPLLAAALSTGTAFADPGNGHSASAPGQVKKQEVASSTATSSTAGQSSADHSSGNAGTAGNATQPQPYSTADQNNTGANDTSSSNPYRSTRDGSPAENGNGNGKATGKPCAGCVGKADNKNPPGQAPNGSDRNAGYECDRNHGVGRSNPAHTGCTSTPPATCQQTHSCPPPPSNCATTGTCPKPTCQDTGSCTPQPPVRCQQHCHTVPPTVTVPSKVIVPPKIPVTVEALHYSRIPQQSPPLTVSSLPYTGSDTSLWVLCGLLALVTGSGLMAVGRLGRPSST